MGIENLLLCGIFFPSIGNFDGSSKNNDKSNIKTNFNDEIAKAEIYNKVNDVGNSRFQTFLTDPQPLPFSEIKTPEKYASLAFQTPLIHENSINYVNHANKLLGGITNMNISELSELWNNLVYRRRK